MTSSIESRVKQTLKFAKSFFLYRLLWARNFHYKHNPKLIDVGWNKVQTYGTFRCPIGFLRASIATEKGRKFMKIEHTPRYPFIKTLIEQKSGQNAKEIYRQHIRRFRSEKDPNKALIKTEKLVESILSVSDFGSDVTIITYPPKYNRKIRNYEVRIYDGVCRASIAKVLGFEYITCRLK